MACVVPLHAYLCQAFLFTNKPLHAAKKLAAFHLCAWIQIRCRWTCLAAGDSVGRLTTIKKATSFSYASLTKVYWLFKVDQWCLKPHQTVFLRCLGFTKCINCHRTVRVKSFVQAWLDYTIGLVALVIYTRHVHARHNLSEQSSASETWTPATQLNKLCCLPSVRAWARSPLPG